MRISGYWGLGTTYWKTDLTDFFYWTLSCISVFVFSFLHYSFCFFLVPYGRLSWLPVSIWAHENTVYRVYGLALQETYTFWTITSNLCNLMSYESEQKSINELSLDCYIE